MKIIQHVILLLLVICVAAGSAMADTSEFEKELRAFTGEGSGVGEDNSGLGNLMMDCPATPELVPDHITEEKIKESNNLTRRPGDVRMANGDYIMITGKVVDEDCAPVENATIRIWQTDSAGKYADDYKLNSEWDVLSPDYDKNFAYSGTTYSDNMGDFSFITILPVSNKEDVAPHINIRVTHRNFKEIQTMMYFAKHPKNDADNGRAKLSEDKRTLVTAVSDKSNKGKFDGRVYKFLISLPGINRYGSY